MALTVAKKGYKKPTPHDISGLLLQKEHSKCGKYCGSTKEALVHLWTPICRWFVSSVVQEHLSGKAIGTTKKIFPIIFFNFQFV